MVGAVHERPKERDLSDMRVVFIGESRFSREMLFTLLIHGYNIAAVVSRPLRDIDDCDELMIMARSEREIGALAIYRGSFINVPYAEAFQAIRMIL